MKKLFFLCLFVIGCSAPAKTPAVCQANLQFCTSAYQDNQKQFCDPKTGNHCFTPDEWNSLCLEDLQICKTNW